MKYGVRFYGDEGLEYLSLSKNGKLTTYRDENRIAKFDDEWDAHLQARNYLVKNKKKYFYEIGTITDEEEDIFENSGYY